jgi:hypothetical protein
LAKLASRTRHVTSSTRLGSRSAVHPQIGVSFGPFQEVDAKASSLMAGGVRNTVTWRRTCPSVAGCAAPTRLVTAPKTPFSGIVSNSFLIRLGMTLSP